ncbi:cytidylyltransferase domain-containing protein [Polynucleobacter sp. AP-Elch-400A-B2]|uniref:acylneuraminate cytidylyltransferase family protein n=1 Tax=Polynucleobacter sp. AP-Elch-400A-B2 TaxID=2576930 RepID=UPI0021111436|nr:acylneuraminate cytidylyltransferase family protein [Polynucleobacter sp. AP-Elch-400A-B2]
MPARGGSKGIPQKNIKVFSGKPLIAHTIETALQSGFIDDVLVSTDSPEIAKISIDYGAEAPFLRPQEISGDNSQILETIVHALNFLMCEGRCYSRIVLLQPTSPLRTTQDIDSALSMFMLSDASSLVSVESVPHKFNPESIMFIEDGLLIGKEGMPRHGALRQDKKNYYVRNGPAILISKHSVISRGSLYGEHVIPYVMDRVSSIDIDDLNDWSDAEYHFNLRAKKDVFKKT